MNKKYENKIAIITGSAGGLGKEFARRLLLSGASVCLSDVNSGLGAETLTELSSEFGQNRVCFVKCDVTRSDDWNRYCKKFILIIIAHWLYIFFLLKSK